MAPSRLFIAQPDIGQRVYGGLAVAQTWEGELENKARLSVLAEDLTQPEFWFLRGGRSLAVGAPITAVAAQFSTLQLVPDATTQSLIIVDSVIITNTQAAVSAYAFGFGIPTAGLPVIQPVAMDDGNPAVIFPGSISAAEVRAGTAAVAPSVGNCPIVHLPANSGLIQFNGPWIIRRHTAFIVRSVAANILCTIALKWRERVLLDTERARF